MTSEKDIMIYMKNGDIDSKSSLDLTLLMKTNEDKSVSMDKWPKILDKGKSCIFVLESGDIKPAPDFKNECCNTTACFYPDVKDSDI